MKLPTVKEVKDAERAIIVGKIESMKRARDKTFKTIDKIGEWLEMYEKESGESFSIGRPTDPQNDLSVGVPKEKEEEFEDNTTRYGKIQFKPYKFGFVTDIDFPRFSSVFSTFSSLVYIDETDEGKKACVHPKDIPPYDVNIVELCVDKKGNVSRTDEVFNYMVDNYKRWKKKDKSRFAERDAFKKRVGPILSCLIEPSVKNCKIDRDPSTPFTKEDEVWINKFNLFHNYLADELANEFSIETMKKIKAAKK